MDSILISIKKLLGIDSSYDYFDQDLIMHINSVFMVLNQLGVGPSEGFSIVDESDIWNDFIGEEEIPLDAVKSYVYLKVRLLFDPPSNSALIESTNRLISEFEWRLNISKETI